MIIPNSGLLLVGRVLMSLVFIIAGYGKLMGMAGTVGYFTKLGIPAPDLAYYATVAMELGVGLLLLIGFQTRIVAVALALFTLATIYFAHNAFIDPTQQTQLLKNLCMAGGLLTLASVGGGLYSVDGMIRRPTLVTA